MKILLLTSLLALAVAEPPVPFRGPAYVPPAPGQTVALLGQRPTSSRPVFAAPNQGPRPGFPVPGQGPRPGFPVPGPGPRPGFPAPGPVNRPIFSAPGSNYGPPGAVQNFDEPAKYEFSYEVNDAQSGNNFGHTESRDGDNTQGSYFVLLPDGRLQRVTYTADVSGYQAKVSYDDSGRAPSGNYGAPSGTFGSPSRPGPSYLPPSNYRK